VTNEEAIETLNHEIEFWARIIGKFEKRSYWFKEGQKKIQAFRLAIEILKKGGGCDD
jgi:hypothetical protein